ncbi:hypothetical protein LL033_08235 [Clostridium estertheticum]|uniref:hypothetical protein n=1 Tax=Clostridium estertheticum TaxID=238834 RepID=UPI001C0E110A|nr:hypothetical protein [Clostridium estertheticum]MBU3214797.1 hypothetical protein [Clostridium estertheticum]WAG57208.1 hypothetical protein LL033_08235 [Clostridium estertheticum]
MGKKEHLRKILKIVRENPSFAEMNTEIKSYNKFIKELKVDAFNKEADEIFKKFFSEGVTLKSMTAKSRGKEYLESKLMEFGKMQEDYYKKIMYPPFIKEVRKMYRSSDADIIKNEHEYKHSVILADDDTNIFNLDNFLLNYKEGWAEFNGDINRTLQLVFNDYYKKDNFNILNISQFEKIIEEAIQEYLIIKANHQDYKGEVQNENPYCNLYMYCRNAYVLNYFELALPDDSLFKECKNFNIPIRKKEFYSLRDIANNYAVLININDSEVGKAYDRIKKNFHRSRYIQRFKPDKEYSFRNLSTPLAYYIYYRKKNHNANMDTDCFGNNYIIEGRVAPILNAKINCESQKLKAVYKYLGFIQEEFKGIFSTLNNRYQKKMINFLKETIVNLFYRSAGLEKQIVYKHYHN